MLYNSLWVQLFCLKCLNLTRQCWKRGREFNVSIGVLHNCSRKSEVLKFWINKNSGPEKSPKINPFPAENRIVMEDGWTWGWLNEGMFRLWLRSVALISNHPVHSRCVRLASVSSHNWGAGPTGHSTILDACEAPVFPETESSRAKVASSLTLLQFPAERWRHHATLFVFSNISLWNCCGIDWWIGGIRKLWWEWVFQSDHLAPDTGRI